MIETGRAIELRDDYWQLDANPPFVAASAGLRKDVAPFAPPPGHESCERLDDQHVVASRRALDQTLQQRLARSVVQLIERERREHQHRRLRESGAHDIVLARPCGEAERAIRACRFAEDPPMPIDADDLRATAARMGPCRTRCARTASEIDERRRTDRRLGQRANDFADEQVVKRTVEERERGALARARQRGAFGQSPASFDVGR